MSAPAWRRERVEIRLGPPGVDNPTVRPPLMPGERRGHPVRTWALVTDAAPGLAVHAAWRGSGYAVTHLASGFKVRTYATAERAQSLAVALARCGDWTRDAALIRNDPIMRGAARRTLRGYDRRERRDARAAAQQTITSSTGAA